MRLHLPHTLQILAILAGLFSLTSPAQAQPMARPGGPTVSDSSVGYIENAIPGNLFRLRFDAVYDNHRPTRAEFFYARSGPSGSGLALAERNVDHQDVAAYLELLVSPSLSGFVEMPVRFLNPDINDNTAGLSDMNAGLKYAFFYDEGTALTFQFRSYFPTGDAERGLGTDHVSLEPALLVYQQLDDRLGFEGEFHWWIPIDGDDDFAGDVIRYGLGLHYDLIQGCDYRISPVVEVVGWTVLDGQESVRHPTGLTTIEDSEGDTIVNGKLGVRLKLDGVGDIYGGYGHALTGDRWYEEIVRLEFRLFF